MKPDDAPWADAVGRVLSGLLGEHRMNQVDLANESGVHVNNVRRYLSGERFAPPGSLVAMCEALGVTASDVWARAEKRVGG